MYKLFIKTLRFIKKELIILCYPYFYVHLQDNDRHRNAANPKESEDDTH